MHLFLLELKRGKGEGVGGGGGGGGTELVEQDWYFISKNQPGVKYFYINYPPEGCAQQQVSLS